MVNQITESSSLSNLAPICEKGPNKWVFQPIAGSDVEAAAPVILVIGGFSKGNFVRRPDVEIYLSLTDWRDPSIYRLLPGKSCLRFLGVDGGK